jgi:hypothetical protein
MISPFLKAMQIDEAKSKLASAIESLTKGKNRKYVKQSELKAHMDLDDNTFDEVITSAQKSNRHSNKYVFTNVDDEAAIGIAASKRHVKQKANTPTAAGHGVGIAHSISNKLDVLDSFSGKTYGGGLPGAIPVGFRMVENRSNELYGIYNRHGWRGLDRLDILPEGWQGMSAKTIVETILAKEFGDVYEDITEPEGDVDVKFQMDELRRMIKQSSFYDNDLHHTLSGLLRKSSVNPKQIMQTAVEYVIGKQKRLAYVNPTSSASPKKDLYNACKQVVITCITLGLQDEINAMKTLKLQIPSTLQHIIDNAEHDTGKYPVDIDENLIKSMIRFPSKFRFMVVGGMYDLKTLAADWDINIG